MYMQRYMAHFPAAGEIVIFDRSWYNRAGVEHVMGFCSKTQYERFLELCPEVEKLHRRRRHPADQVLAGGQQQGAGAALGGAHRRSAAPVEALADGPRIVARAGTSTRARATPCSKPPTPSTRPGIILRSDDKKRARLNCIAHLLESDPLQEDRARKGRRCRSARRSTSTTTRPAEGPALRRPEVLTVGR